MRLLYVSCDLKWRSFRLSKEENSAEEHALKARSLAIRMRGCALLLYKVRITSESSRFVRKTYGWCDHYRYYRMPDMAPDIAKGIPMHKWLIRFEWRRRHWKASLKISLYNVFIYLSVASLQWFHYSFFSTHFRHFPYLYFPTDQANFQSIFKSHN